MLDELEIHLELEACKLQHSRVYLRSMETHQAYLLLMYFIAFLIS
nr:hypothetical protein [Photobacterium leiognathi]